MDNQKPPFSNYDAGELDEQARIRHEYIVGQTGIGYTMQGLSDKTMVRRVKEGILFKQGEKELVLTKEELLSELKICLETGFIKKEELFG